MSADSYTDDSQIAGQAMATAVGRRWRVLKQERESGGKAFRYAPGRDAADLRAMAASAGGDPMLAKALVRLGVAMQGELLAASGLKGVYVAGGNPEKALEGARGCFGFGVPIAQLQDVRDAVERANQSPDMLACVPWPEISGAGQWWPILNENRFRDLVIATGWPGLEGEADGQPKMAIVGRAELVESGRDDMLATVHDDRHVAEKYLSDAGLDAKVVVRARSLALLRIKGFVTQGDARIAMAIQAGLDGLRIVGALPRP